MQVMRWMGIKEYEAFCKGKTLKNSSRKVGTLHLSDLHLWQPEIRS